MTKSTTRNWGIGELPQQGILEDMIRERILRWAGHIMRMDSRRIARPATNGKPIDGRRRPGHPRADCRRQSKLTSEKEGSTGNNYLIWQSIGETGGNRLPFVS